MYVCVNIFIIIIIKKMSISKFSAPQISVQQRRGLEGGRKVSWRHPSAGLAPMYVHQPLGLKRFWLIHVATRGHQ